jgi:hypothetical protein
VKKRIIYMSVVTALAGMMAAGQENNSNPGFSNPGSSNPDVRTVSFEAQPVAYAPNNVKVLGTLASGQTSRLVECSGTQYQAFVFEGNANDQVEVTVTGSRGAFIALADPTLRQIAKGTGKVSATLPNRGPDAEAFYILFGSSSSQPARVAVHLRKIAAQQSVDATR